MATKPRDIITAALQEIGVIAPGDPVTADDLAWGLLKLNQLLDKWNAEKKYIYSVNFANYVLTPNHQPHTIGPGGNFNVTQRPVKVENANLIINTSVPNVTQPLFIRDADWWANNRVQTLTSNFPTDLYYEPEFPLGFLNLWPIALQAYGLQLETWTLLQQFADVDTVAVTLPPGYFAAIELSLAEMLCAAYERDPSASLVQQARDARLVVKGANYPGGPRIATRDPGIPGSQVTRKSNWNWLTGQTR